MTEIANCSWALACLGHYDEDLFQLFSQRVVANIDACEWTDLADTTRAFAKFGVRPGDAS